MLAVCAGSPMSPLVLPSRGGANAKGAFGPFVKGSRSLGVGCERLGWLFWWLLLARNRRLCGGLADLPALLCVSGGFAPACLPVESAPAGVVGL